MASVKMQPKNADLRDSHETNRRYYSRCQLKQVVDFLVKLAAYEKIPVNIWCSSQARACIESVIQLYPTLHATLELNSKDIERYLKAKIPEPDNLELEEGYKYLVLTDLSLRAEGCFLWASLMLDSITNAGSLQNIQEQINEGLPENYEVYYTKKLDSVKHSDRKLVS